MILWRCRSMKVRTALERLHWSKDDRAALRKTIFDTGVPIWGMGVSAHRKFPMGSVSPEVRQKGLDILYRSIELAADLGIKVIQIMGYDAFYEPSDAYTQARYLEGLKYRGRVGKRCWGYFGTWKTVIARWWTRLKKPCVLSEDQFSLVSGISRYR